MDRALRIACLAIVAGLCTVVLGGSKKIAKDLEKVDPEVTVEVIIQYNQPPTKAHYQKVIDKGGTLKYKLDVINAAAYSVKRKVLDELAEDPDVVYISLDRNVKP